MFSFGTDRTLPASRRRREEARRAGRIVQSRALTSGILLIVAGMGWGVLIEPLPRQFAESWPASITGIRSSSSTEPRLVWEAMAHWRPLLFMTGLCLLVMLGSALLVSQLQTRGWVSVEHAGPHWSRISPVQNLRRAADSMVFRSARACLSLMIGSIVAAIAVWDAWHRVCWLAVEDSELIGLHWGTALQNATLIVGLLCIGYGVFDLLLRQRSLSVSLRMTPHEWKEEQRALQRTR